MLFPEDLQCFSATQFFLKINKCNMGTLMVFFHVHVIDQWDLDCAFRLKCASGILLEFEIVTCAQRGWDIFSPYSFQKEDEAMAWGQCIALTSC